MDELIARYKASADFRAHYAEIEALESAPRPGPNALSQII